MGTGAASVAIAAGTISDTYGTTGLSGLPLLGVSAVGGVLNYVGYEKELADTRVYNHFAADTGACAAPL